jgi:CRP-like cAMP-binding protein
MTQFTSPPSALIASLVRPAYNFGRTAMDRQTLIQHVPLFATLNAGELAALAQDFTRAEYAAGETIFQQGDSGHALYLIETGKVRIFVQNEDGQELSVNVCGAGEVFGEMSVIDELPRSASAEAMEPTALLRLTRDQFREHLRRSPQLALAFMKSLSALLRRSTRELDNLTLATVPTRLARKLMELTDKHGQPEPGGVRVAIPLTQSELASMLGATRESVNKALRRFRQRGLIRWEQSQIVIVDVAELRTEAE